MRNIILTFLIIIIHVLGFAKKYKTEYIIQLANNILRNELPDSLYRYAQYDTNTYYEYKSIRGESHWETLNKFKRTKGKFVEVDMRWNLFIPFPTCPAIDTIKTRTFFMLSNLLQPKEKPYIKLIPDVFWKKRNCNLITKEQAIAFAPYKKDLKIAWTRLDYNPDKETYTLIIYYSNDENIFKSDNLVGVCEINAYTGEIIADYQTLMRVH